MSRSKIPRSRHGGELKNGTCTKSRVLGSAGRLDYHSFVIFVLMIHSADALPALLSI